MNQATTETRSVVVDRELPHPPEKIWRALTQPHLIEAWLMKSDFEPVAGRAFSFRADWGSVDCTVLAIEPHRTLSYTWAAHGLESVVTWTLTPTPAGTHLRMEQVGFRADQEQAYRGAQYGWVRFFESLEQVLSRPDTQTEARA
ncbi:MULTISPECIES: SRPBCC family protein [Burkholderia cepacia complex]|uniref:SRPBCC family protein n=1 Tax=Burkholderia cepacia complex TaxID=87882 RepID=UPI000F55D154|nr:SRPBCC domain-containing protein [Burkholderia cenocepacia]MBR7958191.1 SRPBCC domain-containing protein [Burkholderia cenocepacia]MBR8068950.1 SRPBCC domain-containing protein [Burkholderia cenocepacia]MBR8321424.1 SRPBCC domain-containing protein [Burkholderia cenocepacia]MBR8445141.1 SRPBCC domain-containing protein [Burkholderia cenocepacia]RQV33517.1 SRPBCC domain-containing protein [Burkholderia cenocepacia]